MTRKLSLEVNPKSLHGCSLDRAYPYIVRDEESGEIVQYAKTKHGAELWIESEEGKHTLPEGV